MHRPPGNFRGDEGTSRGNERGGCAGNRVALYLLLHRVGGRQWATNIISIQYHPTGIVIYQYADIFLGELRREGTVQSKLIKGGSIRVLIRRPNQINGRRAQPFVCKCPYKTHRLNCAVVKISTTRGPQFCCALVKRPFAASFVNSEYVLIESENFFA